MNCELIGEHLSAYYDKELPPNEMGAVASHLANCDACQEALEEYASIAGLFVQAVKTELPCANLEFSIANQLRQDATEYEMRRIRLSAIATAVALLCLVTGLLVSPVGRTMWRIGSVITREVGVLLTWYQQSSFAIGTIILATVCIGLGVVCFLYLLRVIRKFEPI